MAHRLLHGTVLGDKAVDETYYALVIFLLERGANPNIPDNEGDTPLDIAKYSHLYKHSKVTKMVDTLIKLGGTGKDGPSARELLDDKIHEGFAHASAMKNFFALIEKKQEKLEATFFRTTLTPKRKKTRPVLRQAGLYFYGSTVDCF
jgi:hypothetical protein